MAKSRLGFASATALILGMSASVVLLEVAAEAAGNGVVLNSPQFNIRVGSSGVGRAPQMTNAPRFTPSFGYGGATEIPSLHLADTARLMGRESSVLNGDYVASIANAVTHNGVVLAPKMKPLTYSGCKHCEEVAHQEAQNLTSPLAGSVDAAGSGFAEIYQASAANASVNWDGKGELPGALKLSKRYLDTDISKLDASFRTSYWNERHGLMDNASSPWRINFGGKLQYGDLFVALGCNYVGPSSLAPNNPEYCQPMSEVAI